MKIVCLSPDAGTGRDIRVSWNQLSSSGKPHDDAAYGRTMSPESR